MTKLTIGIGEDFPVEEKAGDRGEDACCLRRHRDRRDRYKRFRMVMRECLWRPKDEKKDGER